MPYIARDFHGKIIGLSKHASNQATEFLPEEHPDVVAFRRLFANHKPPRALTDKEEKKLARDRKRLENEHEELQNALSLFHQRFSELETAMSALLYAILHLENRSSKVPYAIYYSPTSFHARIKIVDNALTQLAMENDELKQLPKLWEKAISKINSARNLRNNVSHAAPLTLAINNKQHVRLTSPAFDVIRVGRTISNRQIPGLTARNIVDGNKNLRLLIESVDAVNLVIAAFHANAPKALREKFRELRASLQTLDNQ